ncbi:MAG: hypothetical protein WDZ28_00380 [Simkaniaceae bacterium]
MSISSETEPFSFKLLGFNVASLIPGANSLTNSYLIYKKHQNENEPYYCPSNESFDPSFELYLENVTYIELGLKAIPIIGNLIAALLELWSIIVNFISIVITSLKLIYISNKTNRQYQNDIQKTLLPNSSYRHRIVTYIPFHILNSQFNKIKDNYIENKFINENFGSFKKQGQN